MMKDKGLFTYIWPLILVIVTVVCYHVASKETASNIVPYASLVITYGVAAVLSFIFFLITAKQKNFLLEVKKTNWASWAYGVALVATEAGFVYVYRSGWAISVGSLVVNISLACLLIIIGRIFYKEHISPRQLAGLLVCIIGLIMINY